MRKLLLASAAMLGVSGGLAVAQTTPNPLQGQYPAPLYGGPSVNNNNNAFGTTQAGTAPAPAPGTVVIRLNGRLYADFSTNYGSGLRTGAGTIVPASGAAANASGYKLNPVGIASYFRLYPGIDGVATNGLRYGASVEIRENFEGGNNFSVTSSGGTITTPSGTATSGTAASASGVSSAQTLYVRRAFAYLGTDQMGIIRIGQGDGLPGIYDATGIFTIGSWDGGIGNLNGSGGFQVQMPNQYLLSWPFISGSGADYANNKIVYLSPQFFGVDVGLEFAPNQGNILSNSSTSSPLQVGPCNTASANCISVTSGTDSSRWINRLGLGARYAGSFSGVDLKAYGVYIASGKASNGSAVQAGPADLLAHPAVAGLAGGGSGTGALKYDGESFFNGGVAVSYLGFTVNADVTAGRTNGSNAMVTTGGADMMAELIGISYAIGPYSIGAIGAIIDSQGSVQMTHVSQRHEFSVAVGGAYRVAPGINLAVEYTYEQKHQGGFNFNTSANGVASGNNIHGQGLTVATIVSW